MSGRLEAAVRELAEAIRDELLDDALPPTPPDLCSINETARRLAVGRSSVYELIAQGRLRSVKAGRRRLIPASAIAALVGTGSPMADE
jgi:excisionase family DNA binding protein